ncbi:MAG: DUF2085 domain-containing protein [Anaerolineales bacterium]|nr:DUF2085 domain-containing protein [Anaerolineales bacterium]
MDFEVTLYTRQNCKLCDQAKHDLNDLQKEYPHNLLEVDIDQDQDLVSLYGHKVPVITAGPFTLTAPFDKRKLQMTLGAARDSHNHRVEDLGESYHKKLERKHRMTTGDKLSHFIAGNYLKLINLILVIYVGLPFLAPVLMNAGYEAAAQPIYKIYRLSCHELAFRSWFLFGEQPYYPRASAGIEGMQTYGQASGYDEHDLITARDFTGNQQMGYKVAFCQRDIAIYTAMLAFSLIFGLTGRRLKPLPFLVWILVGILPVGLDGGSQLISQVFTILPFRETTPLLRTITGALFGFTTAWFGIPVMEESFKDTRQYLAAKKARLGSKTG